jgi:hypothetical protein
MVDHARMLVFVWLWHQLGTKILRASIKQPSDHRLPRGRPLDLAFESRVPEPINRVSVRRMRMFHKPPDVPVSGQCNRALGSLTDPATPRGTRAHGHGRARRHVPSTLQARCTGRPVSPHFHGRSFGAIQA